MRAPAKVARVPGRRAGSPAACRECARNLSASVAGLPFARAPRLGCWVLGARAREVAFVSSALVAKQTPRAPFGGHYVPCRDLESAPIRAVAVAVRDTRQARPVMYTAPLCSHALFDRRGNLAYCRLSRQPEFLADRY